MAAIDGSLIEKKIVELIMEVEDYFDDGDVAFDENYVESCKVNHQKKTVTLFYKKGDDYIGNFILHLGDALTDARIDYTVMRKMRTA